MECITDFNEKIAAVDQEQLNVLLRILGCQEPNLKLIAYTYHKLTQILHHSFQTLTENNSNTNALPKLCAFPTGSLLMGKPLSPFKIVVFGSIAPDNYHDRVWEVMEKVSDYEISESGVTEVQKLPFLRFFIKLDGVAFDLQYHQSVSLINEYYSESSTAAILNTPSSFVEQNCTPRVAAALLEAKRCAQRWTRFRDEPRLKNIYYSHRAWAIINGVFDDEMDTRIIHSLLQDQAHPDHDIFNELALKAPRYYLDLLKDKHWLELLQHWEELPLSARMVSSNYITISLTHRTRSGISGVESSQWLRHVEKRILTLKSRLARFSSVPSESDDVSETDSRLASPMKGHNQSATIDLDPLFDPSKWGALSFNFQGAPLEAIKLHRDTTIARLEIYNDPDPNLRLSDLVPSIETPDSEVSDSEILKLEPQVKPESLDALPAQSGNNDSSDNLPLQALRVDGESETFNVGEIRNVLQKKLKDKVILWPGRLELFRKLEETANSNTKYPDYEAYYVLGFKTHSKKDWDMVSEIVYRWIQEIEDHETTVAGECFITPNLLTSAQYKQWEDENGWLRPCPRILRDLFLPSPNPRIDDEEPKLPSRNRNFNRSSSGSSPQIPGTKTPSLRSSLFVLSCLRHDKKYDLDEYWIVYMDRHSGLKEIPARDWVSKDVTSDAYKPQGRIEVFKRKWEGRVEVMWDRAEKIDRICGTGAVGESVGGSGNIDVGIDEERVVFGGRMKLWNDRV